MSGSAKSPPTSIYPRTVESTASRTYAQGQSVDPVKQLARLVHRVELVNRTISHDLRQPLRSVHGFCELLGENLAGRLDAESEGYFERIRCAARRMDRTIDAILSLSRLSIAPMVSESIDLAAIVREIAQEILTTHPERTIELSIENDLHATGDPYMLGVLVRSLLVSIRESSASRKITDLRVGSRIDVDGTRVYHVSDHGVGHDPSSQEDLYQPFHPLRACDHAGEERLVLAIAACAAERHGGRLWHQDALLGGTIYFFTLGGLPFPGG